MAVTPTPPSFNPPTNTDKLFLEMRPIGIWTYFCKTKQEESNSWTHQGFDDVFRIQSKVNWFSRRLKVVFSSNLLQWQLWIGVSKMKSKIKILKNIKSCLRKMQLKIGYYELNFFKQHNRRVKFHFQELNNFYLASIEYRKSSLSVTSVSVVSVLGEH